MRVRLLCLSVAAALAAVATAAGPESRPAAATFVPGAEICGSSRGMLPSRSGTQPFTAETIPAAPPLHLDAPPPAFSGIGTPTMPVTTTSSDAQFYFNQGLRLAFAFNHAEARRAFRYAQRLDPECAMCWWGEAFVLGPNINAPMSPEAVPAARTAVRRAQSLSDSLTPRERALIDALAERYADDATTERKVLDQAWARAMEAVANRYPTDDNLQALYAEAVMNVSPWDYWERDGRTAKGRMAAAVAALERVLERNPGHTGAIHFYIHAVEASATPERALPYAQRLGALAPGAGHLVHMPSHIYFRLGMYREALHANVDAVAADERYFRQSSSDVFYRNGYYPHNLHFLMASAQMGGDGALALAAADKLDHVIDPAAVRAAAALQPIKAAPYLTHAQFATPREVLSLREPDDEFALVKAMWHYARAVARAARGEIVASEEEIDRIIAIEQAGDLADIEASGVPARDMLRIARLVAQARLADARGELPEAARFYREAVAIQDSLPYMEPPYWYYPVRQSLGAVLLRMGDAPGAALAFEETLARVPNNGWALYGLQQTYRQLENLERLAGVTRRLEEAWFAELEELDLKRL